MIGSDGKKVFVGWSRHEILWVRAALDSRLTRFERAGAFEDIAAMTGRSFATVRGYAYGLAAIDRESARRARLAADRDSRPRIPPPPLPPSMLNRSARMQAMRMGGRA